MKNPDSPLALILAFFAPAALFLACAGIVYVLALFVVATVGAFALRFMSAESAIWIGILAASAVLFLIARALPNPPAKQEDS